MSKGSIKTAKRYAKALSELCKPGDLENTEAALKNFSAIWQENQELRNALSNPAFDIDSRIAASGEVAKGIKPNDKIFANFISLLCKNGRISEINLVYQAFSEIVTEIKKLLSLKVFSAFEISNEEKNSFASHIQREFGSIASVEWSIETEIIGGLRIRAGDMLLDGSLKGALEKLEKALLT